MTPSLNLAKEGETLSNETKDKAIKKEIARLNKILADVDDKKRKTAEGLIEESAFMRATLQELKQEIDINGPIDEMSQGDYSILREHPALKSYNTVIQRYTNIIKQLLDLLPKDVQTEDVDILEEFVLSRGA